MPLYDHAALHEPKADPRAGERELLKFECMRLAATRPDICSTEELVAAGQAIFEAVTGGDVEIVMTPPQINLAGAS